MKNRSHLHALCVYHEILQKRLPTYLCIRIKFRAAVHILNLRFKGYITPPLHHSEFYKRCFTYRISKLYNDIPENLKDVSSHGRNI